MERLHIMKVSWGIMTLYIYIVVRSLGRRQDRGCTSRVHGCAWPPLSTVRPSGDVRMREASAVRGRARGAPGRHGLYRDVSYGSMEDRSKSICSFVGSQSICGIRSNKVSFPRFLTRPLHSVQASESFAEFTGNPHIQ